jgi:hypothetical protein
MAVSVTGDTRPEGPTSLLRHEAKQGANNKEREMNNLSTKVARITGVVVVAAALAPAAFAKGGAVSHVYAPPPLDAGSAVPNPEYQPKVTASNATLPNPDYFPEVGRSLDESGQRPDDRASWASVHGAVSRTVVVQSEAEGFDWGDAGIGAAGGFGVVLAGVGSALVLRRNRRHTATA